MFPWGLFVMVCFFCWARLLVIEAQTSETGSYIPDGNHTLTLHWKNGDALSGTLLPSKGPWVSWDSPVFLDPLQVNIRSLHSIRFPEISRQNNHRFRFTTVFGDVFDADFIGSDPQTLMLKSQRFGMIQLNRSALYAAHRKDHPDELFDGSRFDQWSVALGGPIMNLKYKVYKIDGRALLGKFPDLTRFRIDQEGHLASSYFDLGISSQKQDFGMDFEGQLQVSQTGEYQFHLSANNKMRFWIDGEFLAEAANGNVVPVSTVLSSGVHQLKVEYVNGEGMRDLRVWWSGPGFKNRSLVGTNRQMGWREDVGGHAITGLKRTGLFKSLQIPDHFVMELVLASSSQPQFTLGFGNSEFEAESEEALKIETWGSDVVLAQGSKVESLQGIEEGDLDVSLHLLHDAASQAIQVLDMNGTPLLFGSLKQSVVVDSSCSAEYVAASVCVKKIMELENMLAFLNIRCEKPYTMYTDSMACKHIADNKSRMGKVRHLAIRTHLVRCHVSMGDINLVWCTTESMVADVMTKIVSGAQDKRLASRFYNDVDTSLEDLAPETSPKEKEPIQDTQDMKPCAGCHPDMDKN